MNQIILSKSLSLFTHLARGNSIPRALTRKIDRTIRYRVRKKLHIHQKTPRELLYLPTNMGGLNIPNVEMMSDMITFNTLNQLIYSPNELLKSATRMYQNV